MLCFLLRLCHIRCHFFLLIIFLASSKRQVILLHIILPLLDFFSSNSGRSFICCARTGLNIQFPTQPLPCILRKELVNVLLGGVEADQTVTEMKLYLKYKMPLWSNAAVKRVSRDTDQRGEQNCRHRREYGMEGKLRFPLITISEARFWNKVPFVCLKGRDHW